MDAEDILKLLQFEEERSAAIKKEADRARNRAARIIQRNFANWRRRSERAEADLQRDREIFNADAERRRDREIFEQFGRDDLKTHADSASSHHNRFPLRDPRRSNLGVDHPNGRTNAR